MAAYRLPMGFPAMTLEQALHSKGLAFKRVRQDQLSVCCLFCGERHFKMGLSTSKNAYFCFRCNTSGTLHSLLRRLEIGDVELIITARIERPSIDLPEGFTPVAKVAALPMYKNFMDYLERRGITVEDCDKYHIGVCVFGRYAMRVVFPVFEGGELYSWTARAINKDMEPKYLMAPNGERKLWGIIDRPQVVIAEGVIKSLYLEKVIRKVYGRDNLSFVSSLGNFVTEAQVEQLVRNKVTEAYVYPDPPSNASFQGTLRTANLLRENGIACYFPTEFPDKQADDYGPNYPASVACFASMVLASPLNCLRLMRAV